MTDRQIFAKADENGQMLGGGELNSECRYSPVFFFLAAPNGTQDLSS